MSILEALRKALTENKIAKLIDLAFIWIPETEEEKATARKLLYKLAEQYIKGEIKF